MDTLTLTNVKQYGNKSGIYHIVVEGTSHHYVGSAKDLRKRLNAHRNAMKRGAHENSKMQNCYNKYGGDKFYFEILEYCSVEDLLSRESFHTKKLKPDLNIVQDPIVLNRDDSFKQKVSIAKKKYFKTHDPINMITVYQYSKSGEYIATFKSATAAALKVKGVTSGIIAVCNGRAKTHKGYQWSKVKVSAMPSLIKSIHKEKKQTPKPSLINPNAKKVYQYGLDGTFIREWSCATEAEKALNINHRTIAACCNPKTIQAKSAGKYQWSYDYFDSIAPYENHSKDAKIRPICILDVIELKEYCFDRIADAARFIGGNKFDSVCADISCASRRDFLIEKYLVRKPENKYRLNCTKALIDVNTGQIYKNSKYVPNGATVNKLSDCARVKFRESEKNQGIPWSTLIEDL